MTWYYRNKDNPKPKPHRHNYPAYNDSNDIEVGDIWKCTCFQYYQVSQINQGTDGLLITWRAMWPDETKDFR